MNFRNAKNINVIILAAYIFVCVSKALADESILTDVFFRDITNIAIGEFHLRENTFLFAIPKDNPATDRGMIWGEISIFEYKGRKNSYVSIFDCGPVASRLTPSKIDFSEDDKYLAVESGGEGGVAIDIFSVDDLFVRPNGRGWNGTDKCVKPVATVGGYNIPVTFNGWDRYTPLIESSVPLDRVSTSKQVLELERQDKCCDDEQKIFAWDVFTKQFRLVENP